MIDRLNTALEDRYRLDRELGQGGMATVFLATDLRHDRRVALKVLKPELGAVVGGERFLAEIRTTANLQHPHILPLFDSGEADGLIFYVMPYVEGESLEDRIGRERQLPVEDAVRIAVKVLGALDHAHQAGIVHRDVKPANILLAGGEPLVADFGIALAVSQAGGGRITETGLTLGTPHYMSPEQATGDQAVDPRSDLYAVACVLFEMLAGQPPFVAATAQAVLAKLLTEDAPDVREQRRSTPEHVAEAVERGLERLPADRFQSARDFATALETPGAIARTGRRPARAGSGSPRSPISRLATVLGWGLAAILAGAWLTRPDPSEAPRAPSLRFPLPIEAGAGIDFETLPALSPDERLVAFDTRGDEASGLVLYRLDTGASERLEGTRGARWPFFSPDGRQVGFFTEDAVLAVDLENRRVELLTRDPTVGLFQQRGLWLDDGWIVLDHNETDDLWGLAPGARTPERLTPSEPGVVYAVTSTSARLPGGRALVTRISDTGGSQNAEVVLMTPSTRTLEPLAGAQGTILGVLGPDTILTGGPDGLSLVHVAPEAGSARLIESLPIPPQLGGLAQVVASSHVVVGLELDVQGIQRLVRVDLEGETTDMGLPPSNWEYPRVSPDGNRLLVTELMGNGGERQLVVELRTGALTPLPAGGEHAWSHDGTHVFWGYFGEGSPIVRHRADGTGTSEVVVSGLARPPWVTSASPDGRALLFYSQSIQEVDLASGETRVLIDDDGLERNGMFSPDGRFIAYSAAAGGREAVYVKPYPALDRRWTISPGNGQLPMWAPDGRTLYFVDGSRMYAVALEFSADGELRPGTPELLFDRPFFRNPLGDQSYDLAADGSLVMIDGIRKATPVVVVNWLNELRRRR